MIIKSRGRKDHNRTVTKRRTARLGPPAWCLLDVHVVVDVLGAVAVVAVALGAVAELLVGVVGVGLAADGALVDVALLLLGFLGCLLEVDRLAGGAVLHPAEELEEVVPEEDE